MKKLLIVALVFVAVVGLLLWIGSWFRAPHAVAASAARPWPANLGTLDKVAARYPARQANAACVRLTGLAKAFPENQAIDEFVAREIARGELSIGEPPALPDVTTIRHLLLHEPLVWPRHEGVGEIGDQQTSSDRVVQMTVARLLVATALARARTQDAGAWHDLQAVWSLARSLEPQPQMMTQTAALSMVRMINAVAWKMPLPVPAWFEELRQRDEIPRLLEAFQYQAASYWDGGTQMFPTKFLAASVEKDRGIAESLARETRCDVTAPANDLGVDLSSVWRRGFRYRAEREATANALRMREGKPIETSSRCSDGTWSSDGTTLRFSREIATSAPDTPMPLVLRVQSSS